MKRTRPDKRRRLSYLRWGKSHSLLSDRDRPISNTIYKGIRFPLLYLEKRESLSPFKVETVLSSLERKGPLSSHKIIDGDSLFLSEAIIAFSLVNGRELFFFPDKRGAISLFIEEMASLLFTQHGSWQQTHIHGWRVKKTAKLP